MRRQSLHQVPNPITLRVTGPVGKPKLHAVLVLAHFASRSRRQRQRVGEACVDVGT